MMNFVSKSEGQLQEEEEKNRNSYFIVGYDCVRSLVRIIFFGKNFKILIFFSLLNHSNIYLKSKIEKLNLKNFNQMQKKIKQSTFCIFKLNTLVPK